MKVNDTIILNKNIFPENKRDGSDPKFHAGKLNYLAIMLKWEYRIVRFFEDDFYGQMVELEILNVPKVKSNIKFIKEDCVLIHEA